MTEYAREVFVDITTDVRIRYGRSERLPFRYAIVLEAQIEDAWTTIRLWDNAHGAKEHHEHEYTRSEGKHEPIVHAFGSTNQAMAAAMTQAARDWQTILDNWRSR
jgi:hypothetical protein